MIAPIAQGALLISVIYWYSKSMLNMINEFYRDEFKKTIYANIPESYPNEVRLRDEDPLQDANNELMGVFPHTTPTDGIPDILKDAIPNNGDNGILTRGYSESSLSDRMHKQCDASNRQESARQKKETRSRLGKINKITQSKTTVRIESNQSKRGHRTSPTDDDNGNNQLCNDDDGDDVSVAAAAAADGKRFKNNDKLLDFNSKNFCFISGKQIESQPNDDDDDADYADDDVNRKDDDVGFCVPVMKSDEIPKKMNECTEDPSISHPSTVLLSPSLKVEVNKAPIRQLNSNRKQSDEGKNTITKPSSAHKFDYAKIANQYGGQNEEQQRHLQPKLRESKTPTASKQQQRVNLSSALKGRSKDTVPSPLKVTYKHIEGKKYPILIERRAIKDDAAVPQSPTAASSTTFSAAHDCNGNLAKGNDDGNNNLAPTTSNLNGNTKNARSKYFYSYADSYASAKCISSIDAQLSASTLELPTAVIAKIYNTHSDDFNGVSQAFKSKSTSSSPSYTPYRSRSNRIMADSSQLNCQRKSVSEYVQFWSNLQFD